MDLTTPWNKTLEGMQTRIGRQDVEIWLKPASPLRLEDDTLVLEVDNQYYREWILENYSDALTDECARKFGIPSLKLDFMYREDPTTETAALYPGRVERMNDLQERLPEPRAIGVNPAQTFSSFVVGECNKFAHAAAQAIADNPAHHYNPLFIYGATGLGKTHLMHAIANEILKRNAEARVVYVTAEDFMNDMINCLRYSRMEEFRNKYRRRATLLLVDDIQFLSGRDRTQEEFFHTFNTLQRGDRQIVLTSDVVPRDIQKLEPRLRTRFEGGLLADMQAPDKETLIAILRQKCDHLGLHLPPDLAEVIANSVAGNIRELEGVLNRLGAMRNFYNEPITLEFARRHLPNLFKQAGTIVTVASIIEAVARFHNVRSVDLTSTKRTRTLTRPRHIGVYLARKHTQLSFPELGREFGGRDHSTIQYAYRKIKKEVRDDPDLAYKIRLLEQALNVRSELSPKGRG